MSRLLVSVAIASLALLAFVAVVVAADPTPVPAELLEGGDLRSDGAGPGIVGNPLLILVAVFGLGLATAGVTVVLARLTRRA